MLYDDRHRIITLDRELAAGGEGKICTIHQDASVVIKLLHRPTTEHEAKTAAMLAKPPHIAGIAWPQHAVRDGQQHVGYLMPRITDAKPLSLLYNPAARATHAPRLDWRYLVHIAANIATITHELHDAGYVIADLNDRNFLGHRNATVTLVDTDSIQVPRPDLHGYFRCTVGTEEYTPPELFGQDFHTIDRNRGHDAYALGTLLFRVLLNGVHPFAGKWTSPGQPPTLPQKILAGTWPYDHHQHLQPPPSAPPITILPPDVQSLFQRCFVYGHKHPIARPTPAEWRSALTRLAHNLTTCGHVRAHVYSNHLRACPWCAHAKTIGIDAFTPKLPTPTTPAPAAPVLPASILQRLPRRFGTDWGAWVSVQGPDRTGWYKYECDLTVFYELAAHPVATTEMREQTLRAAQRFANMYWNPYTGEERGTTTP